ncbi:MAG: riboflavin synthase [Deltaproteobacteria bacterium CG_4_10_14_3_um_filter_60_8]|nr:MAG: riboflavin synthase subunit alpha [Desulfobacterales bacterium CG2_30_60_27]PIP44545.1 MAG: riboflavin synthase [Deltaproteobacteria bacterium CG23_combo_of_CG06-09_8_20_14_all_60_8]PIY24191.1 MAG: riboflavin synthase [Deltaproteobacteria bacterium CG_4_10_14_3_um_filter_60_8]
MFTGIILGKGRIAEKRPAGGGMLFAIVSDFEFTEPAEGESIAVNGVCLTAKTIAGRHFTVDVSPETLTRTNLGGLACGALVNLERALRLADRLGGHLVSGHVDATVRVLERRPVGDYVLFTFALPAGLGRYVIEKGSIAIDGISLTVNRCDAVSFSVSIIPHTLVVTTLGNRQAGDLVNIEVDLIGKYVEKLLSVPLPGDADGSRITPAFLAEHGFLK